MITRKVYLSVLWTLSGGLACAQTGLISTYAGIGSAGYSGDGGIATSAMLNGPAGLAVDSNGNLFIADTNNSRIRKVSGGIMTTVAGGGIGGDGGPATAAALTSPCDVRVDSVGNLYISETCVTASSGTGGGGSGTGAGVVSRIRRVDAATGIITTIAGGANGGFAGDGGPATSALLNTPGGLAIDGSGNIFVADSGNNRVRRIDGVTGVITTVAGNGLAAFAGDGGPATAASLNNPAAVAFDSAGNLYIADGGNSRIRRVAAGTGIITTLAGSGSTLYNGDGILATSANLGFSSALQVNGTGNLLLSDIQNNRVRMVDTSTGLIWTIAGNVTVPIGCCQIGDGGQATLAPVNMPAGVALSPMGPLFVAEHAGQRVRQVALQNPLVSTAVNETASGTSVPYGSPLTLTAVLSVMSGSPATATGGVQFVDAAGPFGSAPVVNGSSSFTTSSLQVGSHTITAQYYGDSIFGASISVPLTVTIVTPSSVALAANPSPAVDGQPITLTATVTPSTATGSVNFFSGAASLGMANISNGTATLTGVAFMAGSYSLTAQYPGNSNLPPSTSPAIALTVKAASSVVATSSANPSTSGQAVTFTAIVTPSTATGTVQFMDNGSSIGSASIVSGAGTFSISTLISGTHSITASYSGDANDTSATSPALTQTVLVSSSVVLTSSQNPSAVGSSMTFTASVTPGTATGTVRFVDGTTVVGAATLAGGSASFTTSTLAQGTHSITAVYSGDTNNAGSTSAALSQSVKLTAGLTLASSVNPSTVGQTVTFTANVNAAASGTVQFLDGVTVLATVPVSSGAAAFSTTALTQGTHSITATYSGDTNYLSAQSPVLTQTVNLIATTTTVTSSQNPGYAGTTVWLTATVIPATATGTVQFLDGTTVLGTGTLSNGSVTFMASALTQGTHPITAVYGGDSADAGSTSAVLSQSMKLSAGMTTGLNPSPGVTGQNVTLTANMNAAATGTVTFSDGSTVLATVTVASGAASYSTTSLTQGSHTLGISYSGDATYMSQSATIAETVLGATSITVTSNANPATAGQSVTFTATVTPAAAAGSVQFYDGQTLTTTVALSGGTASYSTSALTPGSHSITANYLGSSDYAPSYSNALAEVVKTNTSVALASTPNPSLVGSGVTFSATVSPATATGAVQFLDGTTVLGTATLASGSASFTTSALTQGTHSITAVYGGDAADAGSTSTVLSQSVKSSAGMTTGVSPSPAVTGQNVTITANVNAAATGTVTFTDGSTALATVPVASGAASYSTTSLTQGSHTMGISYSGDATYMSQSATIAETVLGATSITVASNANPATTGQSVTFTATVTPAAAAGSVQFYDGQTLTTTVALSGGTASYSTSALTPGSHSITANYLGSSDYAPSYSNALAEVVKTNTSVALASTPNPSLVGSGVTFTATVSPATATGAVQFLDGTTVLGTATLASGSASFSTSALAQGTHSITAVYGGDAADVGSTSTVLSQSVKSSAGMTIGVSPSPAVAGQTVTIRANMNAAATGAVTFSDGSTVLATVTVASGAASYSTSSLAAGVHTLGVSYSGDANYMSASTTLPETVLAASSIGLTSSPNPSAAGQSVTFTALVTPSAATGTVQFLDRGTVIGTATLVSGTALFSTSSLAAGAHSITASYGGDASDAPASSATVAQTVKAVASVSLTSSANPSTVGQVVTFTAGVTPSTATGTVQFLDGSTVIGTVALASGVASFSTSQLTQGSHSIAASYSGDGNDTAATSATLAQTVNPPAPAAPSNLTATAASSSQINLAWTASPTSGVTYNVYSSTASGFTPSASNRIAGGVTATSFAATGLSPSTKYYFRVTAVNAGGESPSTNQATATTRPH